MTCGAWWMGCTLSGRCVPRVPGAPVYSPRLTTRAPPPPKCTRSAPRRPTSAPTPLDDGKQCPYSLGGRLQRCALPHGLPLYPSLLMSSPVGTSSRWAGQGGGGGCTIHNPQSHVPPLPCTLQSILQHLSSTKPVPLRDSGHYTPPAHVPPARLTHENTHVVGPYMSTARDVDRPRVGDMRVSWRVSSATSVSIVAQQRVCGAVHPLRLPVSH